MINVTSANPCMAKEILKECTITCWDLLEEINNRIRWDKSSRDSHEEKLAEIEDKNSSEYRNKREDIVYFDARISLLHSLKQNILDKSIHAIAS